MKGATVARNRQRPASYAEVLDVAARIFSEKGYHQATMQDIAEAARLTKGGLYHHLSSKEATLFAINERYLLSGLAEVRLLAGADGVPVEQRLRNLVVAIAAQHDRYNQDLRIALLEFDSVGPTYRKRLIRLRDEYQGVIRDLIEDGIKQGAVVDDDPDLLVKFIFGALNWMSLWYRPEGRYTAAQIGETFARLILSAVLVRG